jgi:hypothetical protein
MENIVPSKEQAKESKRWIGRLHAKLQGDFQGRENIRGLMFLGGISNVRYLCILVISIVIKLEESLRLTKQ